MRLLSTRFGMADGWNPSIRSAALPWGRKFPSVRGANAFRASLLQATGKKTPIQPRPPKAAPIATAWGERIHGTQTGMLHGIPWSARCVQRFDDSRNSAIHITYRVSLRSSSMGEPRDPLSKVVLVVVGQLRSNDVHVHTTIRVSVKKVGRGPRVPALIELSPPGSLPTKCAHGFMDIV